MSNIVPSTLAPDTAIPDNLDMDEETWTDPGGNPLAADEALMIFIGEWAGPAKKHLRCAKELMEPRGIKVIMVDVDKDTDLTAQFDVSAVPMSYKVKVGGTADKPTYSQLDVLEATRPPETLLRWLFTGWKPNP